MSHFIKVFLLAIVVLLIGYRKSQEIEALVDGSQAVQLEALAPAKMNIACRVDRFSLDIHPSVLVNTDAEQHNETILPQVVSARPGCTNGFRGDLLQIN
jgi:hypothetical protein